MADDLLVNLIKGNKNSVVLLVEWDGLITVEDILSIVGVQRVEREEKVFRITAAADIRADLFRLSAERNLSLLSLKQEENSLEEIFRSLTAKETVI